MKTIFDCATTSTCANANSASSINIETLKEIVASIPEEPIKKYMIEKGCSPDDDWVFIFPISVREKFIYIPKYVKFNSFIDQPFMINPTILDKELK